ncbi:MAG: DeoR/GlpR transcriptional regulator [Ruminococcaceae bacterium]|nr:DeoR/GlpR transcriptional regulator [Oscillospiraceae bacterium]
METQSREKDILDILYEKERVSVLELAKTLFVSEMTVRRDLSVLEKKGVIKRYRGGAVLSTVSNEMPISRRFFVDEDEKKYLGQQAAKFLSDNLTVYIDSSSTCQYIIPHMSRFKDLTLITNSVNSLLYASKLQIPCILLGGKYYDRDMCLVGTMTEEYAAQFNVDLAFFSPLGISENGIISDIDIEQTSVRKIIMKRAKKKVFLFEKNKLNKTYLHTLCHRDDIDELIISN